MIEKIQRRFALTRLGAVNLVKACISCTVSYLVIALSIGVLYFFTCDLTKMFRINGGEPNIPIYVLHCAAVIVLIFAKIVELRS